jgi:hypothetical protein
VVAQRGGEVPIVRHRSNDSGRTKVEGHHDPAAFGAPAQLAVLVAPGVGALHRPAAAGLDRGGLPAGGDLAGHAPLSQHLPAGLVVVAGVQMHHRPLRQPCHHRQGVEGGGQQPVVAAIGRRCHHTQRDALRVGDQRAFQALLAAVHRAWPGGLAAAGRLGDAPVHRQLLQLKAERPLVGAKHCQPEPVGNPRVIHSSRRRRSVVAEQVWSAMRR